METLEILTGMVKDLPDMAIWVVIAFFLYKSIVVGSIYGVIRFVSKLIHSAYVTKKTEVPVVIEKEIRATLDGITITNNLPALIVQIERLKGIASSAGYSYIHQSDVEFLRSAIDDKLNKERLK
jgi:hypothetical protein